MKIVIELLIQLIGVVAWPVTVIIILLVFRRNIESLFLRVKRADLPGGVSIETFPDEIREAIELSQEVKEEKPIQEIKEGRPVIPLTEVNVRMLNLGLSPSPSGLDINYYRQLAEKDPNLALAGLRMEIEIMIKNLGIGWRIAFRERDSASIMARKLHNKRAITSRQSELIQTIVRLCNSAVHGVKVTREQALEILDLALILRDQYVAWLSWGFKDK
ncbi:MAG: hypothetical protein JXA82_01370 [Sedimentisphaerales bacterium]|nr:hypothetical protein [Sedimentisphaerales bacterium]